MRPQPVTARWCDVVLFVVAFALYSPSLQNGFVGDDVIYFIGNTHIRSFDARTILLSGAIGADYLPLRDLSFALDYWLWGNNPFGFHLTNVTLFGLTVVAVRHLFSSLDSYLMHTETNSFRFIAWLASALFAIHPNHREVVYAIYNRGALLTVTFSIVTLLSYIAYLRSEGRRSSFLVGALFSFILALMSREYCISLPLVLVLLAGLDKRTRHPRHFTCLVPFFLTAGFFFAVFRQYAAAGSFIPPSASLVSEVPSKVAMAAKIMFFYLVRMVTSVGYFDFDRSPMLAPVAVTVLAAVLVGSILQRQRRPHLLFGLIFYLVCLIPVLNFYKTLPIVSPRYSFLPCMGLFFTVMSMPTTGKRGLLPLLCVGATFIWTMMTMYKTEYWKNNVTFWELMTSRDKTGFAYTQLGYAYADDGQHVKARDALNMVWPQPMDPKFFAALGKACFETKEFDCAIRSFENAVSLEPDNGSVLRQLARSYQAAGDRQNVQRLFSVDQGTISVPR